MSHEPIPSEAATKTLFLSYARGDDEAFAKRLYAGLTNAGFEVWFDRVSMPSRLLTFHQEIRDAIAARERLILVVGPKAVTSDYVTQEWQFAYFAANKCVNPIVRLDGRDARENTVDGYALIPEDLKLLHAEDFRDDALYEEHLQNLIRQLSEPLPPVGKLVAVPELPPGYRAQPERLKALRDMLLIDLRKPVVVTGATARVGLAGMGGIGKSVLANALAHHPEVQRAFKDNIYWIAIGQTPNIEDLQRKLAVQLGDEGLFNDRQTGKEKLRQLLAERAALLILDDVWDREHADAFNVAGPLGRILLTTRDAGLITALAARENHYRVELPTRAEAEALLGTAAEVDPAELPPEAGEIITQCGRLPLALSLCGGMVHGGVSWGYVVDALRDHDLEFLSSDHPAEEQHRNAWVAMDVSLRVLTEEQQQRFAELAVFGLDTGAPESAIATLWEHTAGMAARHTAKLLADLARRSLVQLVRPAGGDMVLAAHVKLHDLLHNFAEGMANKQFGSGAALHRVLLEAYRAKCPDGWPSGPNDGYFLQNLCRHLIAADQTDDAVALLTDLPWVEAKCRAGMVFELQEDYRETLAVLPEAQKELREEEQRVARVTRWTGELIRYSQAWSERRDRHARHEPVEEPEPTQPEIPATCRIWTDEEIEAECRQIREEPTRLHRLTAFAGFVKAECYRLIEFGGREGFVLQHAFNYTPGGPVNAAANGLVQERSTTFLLRRWPSNTVYNPKPALLATLEGHSESLLSVCITPDGRRAVSGSRDNTVRVWDLENVQCLMTLKGHNGEVTSIGVTPDGRRAVSGSCDKTLRLWDLENGQCLRTLEGHELGVKSVSLTPDGRWAVSGGWGTLQLWDLGTGQCLLTLEGDSGYVASVGVAPDGQVALSGSLGDDSYHWKDGVLQGRTGRVRVWDLKAGQCVRMLEGHSQEVKSVSLMPDRRRALSASYDKILLWDLESGQCLRTTRSPTSWGDTVTPLVPDFGRVTVTSDGQYALMGSGYRGGDRVLLWNLESGRCLRMLEGHTASVTSVSVTPDGRRGVSGSFDRTLRVWDLQTGQPVRATECHYCEVDGIAVAANRGLAVSASFREPIHIWDLENGRCLRTLKGQSKSVASVSITPDGRWLVSGNLDGWLELWDLENWQYCYAFGEHAEGVVSVSITADGKRVLSGSWDNTIGVWHLPEQGQYVRGRTLEGHSGSVRSVSVTLDGRTALSGGDDMTVRVWNLESGENVQTLAGHTGGVGGVSVTPDGRQGVSGSGDKTVRVWDLRSGRCLQTLAGHSGRVGSVSVTSDGRWAVSGSDDKTVRVWDLENGECAAVLQATAPIRAVAIFSEELVLGTGIGEVQIVEMRNLRARRR